MNKLNTQKVKDFFLNNYIIIICIISVIIKQFMLLGTIGHSSSGDKFSGLYINGELWMVQVALLMLLVVPVFLFKDKWKNYYMVFMNLVFSIYCIAELWVYRATNHFIDVRYILYPELFNVTNSTLNQFKEMDFLFLIDVFILIIMLALGLGKSKKAKSSVKNAIIAIIAIFIVSAIGIAFGNKNNERFWEQQPIPATNMRVKGIVGYKLNEAYDSLKKYNHKADKSEISEVSEWLENNKENLPDNKYKGMFKGKNVIFLQIESLEEFVIGQQAYGQEITPNLNKMLNNSLYFSNIYQQNNLGSSIDCDFLVNTSVLPLGDVITDVEYSQNKYLSLPMILKEDGYTTALTHVEYNNAWNWAEAGKMYEYDNMWNMRDYDIDEYVGYGLSDESFYRQFKEKIKTLPQPFFTLSPTLSSHGPFEYEDKYKYLNLPEEVDENIMGKYLQGIHYADKQIGTFIDDLDKMGYLDNSIIVIYGDHAGVNKYYKDQLEGFDMEGDWWKVDELKVPLIIYSKDMQGEKFEVNGGLSDLYPTLCYLLDTTNKDYKNYTMGRNLLNTNRTATITPGGVKGIPSSEREQKHLEAAYDIGRKYILNNYYINKSNTK